MPYLTENEYQKQIDDLLKRDVRIAELEAELKWAWDNMRFTAPPAAEDSEYDLCLVCGCPEWKHDEKCTAKQHKETTARLLKGK